MEDRIKIAYLVRPSEGGIKTHLLSLFSGLDKSRFEPVVICPPGSSLAQELGGLGCRVVPLDIVGELNPTKDCRAVLKLRRILREIRPDILHIHSAKAGLIGRLAVASMRRRPKVVLTMHSFIFDERMGRKKRAVFSRAERWLVRYTDRIIAVSEALKRELVADMGLPDHLISVIYTGIAFQDLPKPQHEGLRIGTVSRLAPQKGVEYFIRAAAFVKDKYPEARFVIVGDGPFRGELEQLASELGIRDSIDFLGFQPNAISIAAGFDAFVLTSTSEAFGLTLVEALSQGVPAVATRVGGIPEIIDGETTGLLASPGDVHAIAENICRLLEDRELAESLAQTGRESVRSRFSIERMVSETQEIYLSVLR